MEYLVSVSARHYREEFSMAERSAPRDCLGILLLGRTGFGKSTTGNKLLEAGGGESVLRDYRSAEFEVGYGAKSCTSEIRAVFRPATKEAKAVLVVDTPGFADSDASRSFDVYQGNLALFRDIIRKRLNEKLRIHRVLYFLPCRGPPEKADAFIQDEIRVMYYYFGNKIFDRMVLVATQQKRFSGAGFSEKDREDTTNVFEEGLRLALGDDHPKCPPILYIGFNDAGVDIQRSIESAPVVSNEVLLLDKFVQGTCSKCSAKYIYHGMDDPSDSKNRMEIQGKGEDQKCHPLFIPKYDVWKRVVGGVAHVGTLGIPMLVCMVVKGEIPWPTFTSNDEICTQCKKNPGSKGCWKVDTEYKATGKTKVVTVNHSNQVEEVEDFLCMYVDDV